MPKETEQGQDQRESQEIDQDAPDGSEIVPEKLFEFTTMQGLARFFNDAFTSSPADAKGSVCAFFQTMLLVKIADELTGIREAVWASVDDQEQGEAWKTGDEEDEEGDSGVERGE